MEPLAAFVAAWAASLAIVLVLTVAVLIDMHRHGPATTTAAERERFLREATNELEMILSGRFDR